jgi:hypothetical protein
VSFKLRGEEVVGEITEIMEAEESAKVKVDNKVFRVKFEALTVVEETVEPEPEDVPEEPVEEVVDEKPKARSSKPTKSAKKVVKRKR